MNKSFVRENEQEDDAAPSEAAAALPLAARTT